MFCTIKSLEIVTKTTILEHQRGKLIQAAESWSWKHQRKPLKPITDDPRLVGNKKEEMKGDCRDTSIRIKTKLFGVGNTAQWSNPCPTYTGP